MGNCSTDSIISSTSAESCVTEGDLGVGLGDLLLLWRRCRLLLGRGGGNGNHIEGGGAGGGHLAMNWATSAAALNIPRRRKCVKESTRLLTV